MLFLIYDLKVHMKRMGLFYLFNNFIVAIVVMQETNDE